MVWRRLYLRVLELFYGPLAPLYPVLTGVFFGDHWGSWQRAVLPWCRDSRIVVDLGCGPGDLARELASTGKTVIGIDRSRSMLRLARRRLRGDESASRIRLVCGDARSLPLRTDAVDAIVMTFPTAVFLEEMTHREIARVLRAEGVYVALVSVQPKAYPWWIRPCAPLLQRILGSHHGSARQEFLPGLDFSRPDLPGQWQYLEHPSGKLLLWIARKKAVTAPRGPKSRS